MTDDEQLLRKLAEMEGYVETLTDSYAPKNHTDKRPFWNPLTNWSDCGPLQEQLIRDGWLFVFLKDEGIFMLSSRKHNKAVQDPDLKRAICLAIVESKK